jgi:hypothetical protein
MSDSQQLGKGEERSDVTFLQMVGSILASFFGVQSSERRKRDFTVGKAKAFLLVGVLMTAVWYGVIYAVVKLVLN